MFLTFLLLGSQVAGAVDGLSAGVLFRGGARYDEVRMCVASPTLLGPALDISGFGELNLGRHASLAFTLPVVRPILFAAAFQMLQFEPDLALIARFGGPGAVDLRLGPVVGASFHYGPNQASTSADRDPSFFALGPTAGLHVGFLVERPSRVNDLEIALYPSYQRLYAEHQRGNVFGGMLELRLLRETEP